MSNALATYKTDTGKELVLTPELIKTISDNNNITEKEMVMFAALCEAHKLDPTIREAYLIKYGTQPATMVVGKDFWMRKAGQNPNFDGLTAGVTIINRKGVIERRKGCMVGVTTERLIGGWAEVNRKDRSVPSFDEVSVSEYMGTKRDGSPTRQWLKMPATMIRKVAIVHALREAFPEDFNGLYDEAEMSDDATGHIEVPAAVEDAPVYEDVPPIYYETSDGYEKVEFTEVVEEESF